MKIKILFVDNLNLNKKIAPMERFLIVILKNYSATTSKSISTIVEFPKSILAL